MPHNPTSVWGSGAPGARAAAGTPSVPPPGDEAVQAHSWVAPLLAALLTAASSAHKKLHDDMSALERDREAGIPLYPLISEEEEEAIWACNEVALDRFFALALASTRRTARLCAAPEALAIWALETLKEQAEAALRFGEFGSALSLPVFSLTNGFFLNALYPFGDFSRNLEGGLGGGTAEHGAKGAGDLGAGDVEGAGRGGAALW